jgi:hypothetical protein
MIVFYFDRSRINEQGDNVSAFTGGTNSHRCGEKLMGG